MLQLEYRGKEEVRVWLKDCMNAFHFESASWRLDIVGSADRDPSVVVVHATETVQPTKQSRIRGEKFDDVETMRIFKVKGGKIVHVQHMVNDATVIEKVRTNFSTRPINICSPIIQQFC